MEDIEGVQDTVSDYQQRALNKGVVGFIGGALFGWAYHEDPHGTKRFLGLLYLAACVFWVWGALSPSLPTSARVMQGLAAVPGVLWVVWWVLLRPRAQRGDAPEQREQ